LGLTIHVLQYSQNSSNGFIILILNHIKDLGRQPDSKFCAKSKHMMHIVKP
jgi:hypothetical protein